MSSDEESICHTATAWRVRVEPGRRKIRKTGTAVMIPPRPMAVASSMERLLVRPFQLCGEYHAARAVPASHWSPSRTANMRSVRRDKAVRAA